MSDRKLDDQEKAIVVSGIVAAIVFGGGGIVSAVLAQEHGYAPLLIWGVASLAAVIAFGSICISSITSIK